DADVISARSQASERHVAAGVGGAVVGIAAGTGSGDAPARQIGFAGVLGLVLVEVVEDVSGQSADQLVIPKIDGGVGFVDTQSYRRRAAVAIDSGIGGETDLSGTRSEIGGQRGGIDLDGIRGGATAGELVQTTAISGRVHDE